VALLLGRKIPHLQRLGLRPPKKILKTIFEQNCFGAYLGRSESFSATWHCCNSYRILAATHVRGPMREIVVADQAFTGIRDVCDGDDVLVQSGELDVAVEEPTGKIQTRKLSTWR
jgi:hypothetical protein